MKLKKFRNQLFGIINSTNKLKIVSALPDSYNEQVIYIELQDGSKFQIIVLTTDRFV